MTIAQSKIRFEEVFDPFPSEDDVMDDSCLGPKYKELAKDLFGETEERMIVLIKEFKEATKKDRIDIPGCIMNSISSCIFSLVLKLKSFIVLQFLDTFLGK